jgi:hypothetical protein
MAPQPMQRHRTRHSGYSLVSNSSCPFPKVCIFLVSENGLPLDGGHDAGNRILRADDEWRNSGKFAEAQRFIVAQAQTWAMPIGIFRS